MVEMDLNDDCLILIFNLLDIEDQVAVAQVCRRFHAILSSIWQKAYLQFSMYDDYFSDPRNVGLSILMESICCTVQELDLGCLTCEEWEVIKLYLYPSVEHLTLLQPQTDDDDVMEMTKVFPNLRSFAPYSPDISGIHIQNWRHLENLNLYECEKVEFSHFEKILEKTHLKSVNLGFFGYKWSWSWSSTLAFNHFCNLERISLCSSELAILPDLSHFLNLKEICLLSLGNRDLVCKLIKWVEENKYDDLVELRVNIHFPLNVLFVRTFKNLKKFTLRQIDISDFTKIFKYAPNLREIVIKDCEGLKEDHIYLWLKSSQMELVSVEKCKCEFLYFKLTVKEVVEDRTSLLHFNFYENEFACNKTVALEVQGKSSLLKITNKCLVPDWSYSDRLNFL